MNRYFFYSLCCIIFSSSVKGQVVLLNNPSSHIVAFNPAFSAISAYLNGNYIPNQVCVSSRISHKQSDILASGQHFFLNKNIGISAHYNFVNQQKSSFQKGGIGLSYQLLFFNAISTGWAIGLSYNQLKADSGAAFSVYNDVRKPSLQSSTYASLNLGWLINYENIMAGISVQPNKWIYFTSGQKGTVYTTGSVYVKYKHVLTRTISATIWYTGNWNNIARLQLINAEITQAKLQSHAFNIHVLGRKGLIGGVGCRVTNFNYASVIAKAGYNFKRCQLVYGMEPYWLHARYSEIIHELSFTLKI